MRPSDTPTGIAARAVRALYEDHPVGGHLHIVTDDGNLGDGSLAYCRAMMEEANPREATDAEWDALRALESLSVTARRKAIHTRDQGKWDL